MMKNKYCIYRYLNKKKEIIYVGLTARPIAKRIREHEKEALDNETFYVEYAEVASKSIMQQYEIFYINKYRPKYNIRLLDENGAKLLELPELEFKPFKKKNETIEINIIPRSDEREYSLKFNHGLIESQIINPYARNNADKKININTKGELILNKQEVKLVIEMLIQATNDLLEDSFLELKETNYEINRKANL